MGVSCGALIQISVEPAVWLMACALLFMLGLIACRSTGRRRLSCGVALLLAAFWLPDVLLEQVVLTPKTISFRKGVWPQAARIELDLTDAETVFHVTRWPKGRWKESFLVIQYPEQRRRSHRLTGLAARSQARLWTHLKSCGLDVVAVNNRPEAAW